MASKGVSSTETVLIGDDSAELVLADVWSNAKDRLQNTKDKIYAAWHHYS